MRRLGLLALILVLVAAVARAADLEALDWVQRPGMQVPVDAPLVGADGTATTLAQLAVGRPLILAPGYFKCPNLCGVIRDDLFAALGAGTLQPGRDYVVALLTIDPAETPQDAQAARNAVLDRYPQAQFAALTGPAASLAAIAEAAGFRARWQNEAKQFFHPSGVAFLTPTGAVSSYLFGVGYAAEDVERAVVDARSGAFRRAEPVHLFCFSYDPVTGRFTATVMQAVRLAGIVTVLAIGGWLLVLRRRA
jgi:protein SCO1/2